MAADPDFDAIAVVQIGLQVRDPAASLHFYRDVLGFELVSEIRHDRCLWALRLANTVVKLVLDPTPLAGANPRIGFTTDERRYGMFQLVLSITNVRELLEECSAEGVEIDVPFVPWPEGVSGTVGGGYAWIRDPDGNVVQLVQGDHWPRGGGDR
jgi:catechol 2,3-dioxygenase-like lactoylglutathione lyase family enzyme